MGWYEEARIELRAISDCKTPEKRYYQVMLQHPRECLTNFITKEQAIKYCTKNNLKIIHIDD